MSFPEGFVWGAAAASYQIEGGAYDDGKGLSVWDMLCRKPGAIWSGHTGDVACDHYRRYEDDVAIMKEIGLQAYRLSISWPRVMPSGVGTASDEGLGFYDRLVDALLDAGITPYVTLFHWDYPYELYCRGGWLNGDSPDWFADYAKVVADKLSDRVADWMTLNEPQCFIGLGHQEGRHAPGDRLGFAQVLRGGHNALLAHGKATQAIRAASQIPCRVGYAPVGVVKMPHTEGDADVEAARQATFRISDRNCWNNTWWMDPVFLGHYPEDGLALFGADAPEVRGGDMATISQPMDFFGVNIYNGQTVRAGEGGQPEEVDRGVGYPKTAFHWPVTPTALYWGPRFLHERYSLPMVVTENGMSNADWVSLDGKVHDPQRIDFLQRYIREFGRAGEDGAEVAGYFVWSIMDNFEWAEGYRERFGIVHVDYLTQKRIIKDSAYWYRDVIASNGSLALRP